MASRELPDKFVGGCILVIAVLAITAFIASWTANYCFWVGTCGYLGVSRKGGLEGFMHSRINVIQPAPTAGRLQ